MMQVETIEFLERLNNGISNLKMDERTIENDKNFFMTLHDLYYDLVFARLSNQTALAPSEELNRELNIIYEHLMKTINKLYKSHKKRLIHLLSEINNEELKHPGADTPKKHALKNSFEDIVRFCDFMTIILV